MKLDSDTVRSQLITLTSTLEAKEKTFDERVAVIEAAFRERGEKMAVLEAELNVERGARERLEVAVA